MNKHRFEDILLSTHRNGIERVLTELEKTDFYDGSAISPFFIEVYDAATILRQQVVLREQSIDPLLPMDSIAIATLLHDTCKSDIYKKATLSRRLASGLWEKYSGYSVDYDEGLPLGHGEKSVIMLLSWGLELTQEEMLAIRWHMSAWDLPLQSPEHKESLNAAKKKTPLVALVQLSDGLASGLFEWKLQHA